MDYKRMLEEILTQSEFTHFEKAKPKSDDYSVMQYLEDRAVVCVVGNNDYDEERVLSFIDKRLNMFSEGGMTLPELKPISSSHTYNLNSKDRLLPFSLYCLKYYDDTLKSNGLRIVLVSNPSDYLPFIIVKSENVALLKQMKTGYWNFHTIDEE